MLTLDDATKVVEKQIPNGKIQKTITYKGLYIFIVTTDDPYEGAFDAFYSVNQQSGEFLEFSIITPDSSEIMGLFAQAQQMA